MKQKSMRNFLLIAVLIVATGVAMAYSSKSPAVFTLSRTPEKPQHLSTGNGVLTVSGHLVQNKVLQESEGLVGLNLTLQAKDILSPMNSDTSGVDMVPVQKDANTPPVLPEPATIRDRTYPLAHYLYFYFAGQPTGHAKAFLRFVLSPEGQRIIDNSSTGAVTLPMAGAGR